MTMLEMLKANVKKMKDGELDDALQLMNGLREQAHAQAHAIVEEIASRGRRGQIDRLTEGLSKEERAALKKRL